MILLWCLTLCYIVGVSLCGEFLKGDEHSKLLEFRVQTSWKKSAFALNIIESIAELNESLYETAALTAMGISSQAMIDADGTGDEDDEADDEGEAIEGRDKLSDAQLYEKVMSSMKLDEVSKALVDFNIVYKTQTPRIAAHYDFYASDVINKYEAVLSKRCATDSFGRPVLEGPDDYYRSWLVSGKELYCSPDDLFALKVPSSSSPEVDVLPFDRIIGDNQNAPILILYGDIESDSFVKMFTYLYKEARMGKIRYVWRYIPVSSEEVEEICGYGVDLSFKKYNHLSTLQANESTDEEAHFGIIRKENFRQIVFEKQFPKSLPEVETQGLGMKLTTLVLDDMFDNTAKLDLLIEVLQNFPSIASYLDKVEGLDTADIEWGLAANEEKGVTEETFGLYMNGSPLKLFGLDVYQVAEKIKEEVSIVRRIKELGFTGRQARLLLNKFALMSGVKGQYYRTGNAIMGTNENRYNVYLHEYTENNNYRGGVVFFNNLEKDPNYDLFLVDRKEAYSGNNLNRLRPGQIPSLKENVHDLIFAINFADKKQLKVLFVFAKIVLDKSIPQQIGVIALESDDPKAKVLADRFYHIARISTSQEAFAFLYKYYESSSVEEENRLIESIKIEEKEIGNDIKSAETLKSFSLRTPSVIFNGVINSLSSNNWQNLLNKQITQDVKLVQSYVISDADAGKKLKDLLFENAKYERNLRVIPSDPSQIIYKKVEKNMLTKSLYLRKESFDNDVFSTLWIVGDFSTGLVVSQLITALKFMTLGKTNIQIRVLSTTKNSVFEKLENSILDSSAANNLINELNATKIELFGEDENTQKFLGESSFPSNQNFLLFNSRYLRLDSLYTTKELEQLDDFEFSQRSDLISSIVNTYTDEFGYSDLRKFKTDEYDMWDWYDLLLSELTKSFYTDNKHQSSAVHRYDLTSLNTDNSFEINHNKDYEVDVWLVIDPINEISQKLLSVAKFISHFPGVSLKVILQPKRPDVTENSIGRYYKGLFPINIPQFDDNGSLITESTVIDSILPKIAFTVDLDVPETWKTIIKEVPEKLDLDNILLDENYSSYQVLFELKSIVVEGFASEERKIATPAGLELELKSTKESFQSSVLSNLGYFQFRVSPGLYEFGLVEGNSSENYELTRASNNYYEFTKDVPKKHQFFVSSLKGSYVYPRVSRRSEQQKAQALSKHSGWKKLISSFKTKPEAKPSADINIFSIASGHLYENLLNIMQLSVIKHTGRSVKFWIIEDYISPQFRATLDILSKIHGFDYEYISYKWPSWLRIQRQKFRTVWGYKILFLDVLFPLDLKRVIFMDADQIARADMFELMDMDLEDKPYAFVPMCDSRQEMKGYRFWEGGYWTKLLKDDLKYHISALFVVDLEKFKSMSAGNMLRYHYQKLSSDPNSLSNLDQDLPNNFQRQVPIFSLPQNWLWCETWCSDESLQSAKTIDLCNNPLSKEDKLSTAKRVIPEWVDYNEEIQKIKENSKLSFSAKIPLHTNTDVSEDEDVPTHDEL